MKESNTPPQPPKQRRWPKRLAIVFLSFVIFISLGVFGFLIYAADYYQDLDTTRAFQASSEEVLVEKASNHLAFGDPEAERALIFYPGAKVEFSSYSPLMHKLAEQGYLCIIVKMPLNFAFLDINAAQGIMGQYPQVQHWWIGGHSLGGAMAASFAAGHASELEGLLLLGSYSANDLSETDLSVCLIYGSNDEILNRSSVESSRALMPPRYTEKVIEGGNHAYFGNYGEQAGDGQATITPEEQWSLTSQIAGQAMATGSAPQQTG